MLKADDGLVDLGAKPPARSRAKEAAWGVDLEGENGSEQSCYQDLTK